MHVRIWEYDVKPGCESEFERTYGPGGEWALLFESGEGYLGVELLRDAQGQGRYATVDHWASRAAFEAFRSARADEFEALDRRCSELTERENEIGTFLCLGRSRVGA